jgi:hypothetical protein
MRGCVVASPNEPKPERPRAAGVEEEIPRPSGIEGARLLANEAFPPLQRLGFTRKQVRLWAETYIAEVDTGQVSPFVEWIMERERSAGSR